MPFDPVAAYEDQGPTLLAAQPAIADAQYSPDKDWPVLFSHLESRLSGLRNWRYSWWTYWSELARYLIPERYHWTITPNQYNKGQPINQSIIDSTATLAMQICAAGLWTGLTSPSRPWFAIEAADENTVLDADASSWVEDTQAAVYNVLGGSNFYTIMAQAFKDVVVFGTAPVTIYEDKEDTIRCYLPCAGEYFLAVGSRLSVDTQYREFVLTVSQLVEMFQLKNCPEEVQQLWRTGGGSLDTEFVVCHSIEPNFALAGRDGSTEVRPVPGHFTFREVYWLRGQQNMRYLSITGFEERPFFAARWSVTSNNPYGRSPGMDGLGDTKQLQLETLRKAEFIDKGVRPPMGADPALKNEPSSIISGNVTFVPTDGGKKGFWPLFEPNPAWLAGISNDIGLVQQRIKEIFFVPIFMAISQMEGVQPRNELEITKRDLERLQVLGPFIELFETECADPALKRVMAIMTRKGKIKPMPQSLRGVKLRFTFTSILRLAQQAAETAAMEGFFAVAGHLSEAAKESGQPDPIRIINLDKSLRRYGERVTFPADLYYSEQEVQQADAANAQRLQQLQNAKSGMAAVAAAKDLGQTPIGNGGTALGAMLGQGQGGQSGP